MKAVCLNLYQIIDALKRKELKNKEGGYSISVAVVNEVVNGFISFSLN